MSEIRDYLEALRQALPGSDPALLQDALAETEARFRRERERLAWTEPQLSPLDAERRVMVLLGPVQDRADSYRQREAVLAEARGPASQDQEAGGLEPPRPWPSFFGVFLEPKAYTSLVYLLMGLVTGTLYFTWAVTGLSLSLGLLVLIIGLPMLVFYLGSIRALGLGEGRLVEALLDVRMPRRPPLLPEGKGWLERLKGLFLDGYTWRCLIYLLIHLPLGIISFTAAFAGLSLSLALIAAPAAHWGWHVAVCCIDGVECFHSPWILALLPLGGVLGLAGTLHMALGLGRLQGSLAKTLLVTSRP